MVLPPKKPQAARTRIALVAPDVVPVRVVSLPVRSGNPLSFLPAEFTPFCQQLPLATMVRGLLEWTLDEESIAALFQEHASTQYERELTLFAMVYLLIQVAAGVRASVFAAYQADQSSSQPHLTVSYQALYGKLKRTDLAVPEALVRATAAKMRPVAEQLPPQSNNLLPGYRLRILDGNMLAGTDRRLKVLRRWAAACLPGKSLVVYEPAWGLATDLVLCEDAYTQERTLLLHILPRTQADDLWIADRGFCTAKFLQGVARRQGFFVVREHKQSLRWQAVSPMKRAGSNPDGAIWEQRVRIINPESGEIVLARRVELRLHQPTRNGDRVIAVFTNLPAQVSAKKILQLYRERWTVENHFQFLTDALHCELTGLGAPRAALCMFAMALLAGNALAVVRAALRAAHGADKESMVSGYYLADEVAGDYRALMKLMPAPGWAPWRNLAADQLTCLLQVIAAYVPMAALQKHPRGPKKPREKMTYNKKRLHVSTARLLKDEKTEDTC